MGAALSGHASADGSAPNDHQPLLQQTEPAEQPRAPSLPAGGCVLGMPVHYPQARSIDLARHRGPALHTN